MIAKGISARWSNARHAYELALAGAIGAVFGLYFYVELIHTTSVWLRDAFAGSLIGGSIGFALNAVGPLRDGSWGTFSRMSTWGTLAGAVGGAIGLVAGEIVLGTFQGGLIGRSVSWCILGLGIGVSQGIAYRSRQKLSYGLIGGGIGGFGGGWLFEAIRQVLYDRPELGQGLGIALLGGGLGLALAIVEQTLRRVWVQVLNGRQEGRTYSLDQGIAILGLDEHAAVGLFGDGLIARKHAQIEVTSAETTLRNWDQAGRTKVNGQPIRLDCRLHNGDVIELGETRLLYRNRG